MGVKDEALELTQYLVTGKVWGIFIRYSWLHGNGLQITLKKKMLWLILSCAIYTLKGIVDFLGMSLTGFFFFAL